MSSKAINWALTQRVDKFPSKLVLLALADAAHASKGMTTYVSKTGLSKKTGLAFETVNRHLSLLEEKGFISSKPCPEVPERLIFKVKVHRSFKQPFRGHQTIRSIMEHKCDFSNTRNYLLMLALAHRMEVEFEADEVIETGLVRANQSEISRNTGLCRKTIRKSLDQLKAEKKISEEFCDEYQKPAFRISERYLPTRSKNSFVARHLDTSWANGIGMSI